MSGLILTRNPKLRTCIDSGLWTLNSQLVAQGSQLTKKSLSKNERLPVDKIGTIKTVDHQWVH